MEGGRLRCRGGGAAATAARVGPGRRCANLECASQRGKLKCARHVARRSRDHGLTTHRSIPSITIRGRCVSHSNTALRVEKQRVNPGSLGPA